MRDATPCLYNAIYRDTGGVAMVFCPDIASRNSLVEEVEDMLPSRECAIRETSVTEALKRPSQLILLVPDDERKAVLELDANRDRMLNPQNMLVLDDEEFAELGLAANLVRMLCPPKRCQPMVLFLLREGEGANTLAEKAPSIRSWVGGCDVDPQELALFDPREERAEFERKRKMSPETWLEKWRSGKLRKTALGNRITYIATLIVDLGEE